MTYGFVTDVENGIHDASRRDGSPRFLDASFATRHLLTPRTASCVHMLTSSAEVLTSPNQGGWSRSQLQSNEAETSSLTLWLTALLSQASRQPLPDCCAGGLHGGKLFPWPEHFIRRETPGFALAHLNNVDSFRRRRWEPLISTIFAKSRLGIACSFYAIVYLICCPCDVKPVAQVPDYAEAPMHHLWRSSCKSGAVRWPRPSPGNWPKLQQLLYQFVNVCSWVRRPTYVFGTVKKFCCFDSPYNRGTIVW